MNVYIYILIFVMLLTVIEAVAQYNLKLFNKSNHLHYFIIGAIGYILISYIISYLFGFEKMGPLPIIFLAIIVVQIIGMALSVDGYF